MHQLNIKTRAQNGNKLNPNQSKLANFNTINKHPLPVIVNREQQNISANLTK